MSDDDAVTAKLWDGARNHTPTAAAATDSSKAYGSSTSINAVGFEIDQCGVWRPCNRGGAALGSVVINPHPKKDPDLQCRHCHQHDSKAGGGGGQDKDPLFTPCNCGAIHRSCFKEMRRGTLLGPSNFWSCPDCLHSYNMVRLEDVPLDTEREIKNKVRFAVVRLWVVLILSIAAAVTVVSSIAYASDPQKNVPVGIKAMMTSVVWGFPNSNSTRDWRNEFKNPDVHVVQYYGLLGSFIIGCMILIAAAIWGLTEDDDDKVKRRSDRGCCAECCDSSNSGGNTWFWCYWGSGDCDCCDCSGSSGGDCDCCSDCSGGGCGDCKMDGGGEAAIVILAVVVIVVLVSAIFVVIFYGAKKTSEFQNSVATTIRKRQEELENATIIVGKDEVVRPANQV